MVMIAKFQRCEGGCLMNWRNARAIALASMLVFGGVASANDDPINTDATGFNADLFSGGFSVDSRTEDAIAPGQSVATEIKVESSTSELVSRIRPQDPGLDRLASDIESQGLKIKRLSSSWTSESGTLTVGTDWANFQDTLGQAIGHDRGVASQVRWHSPNGFSIAIEDDGLDDSAASDVALSSPSIILSWQGNPNGSAGEYRVTAMGTKSETNDGEIISENVAEDAVGWGLNLEGGWRIGDLFAALSVTYGQGINSYVLQRLGNEILVTPNDIQQDSYSIRPSLYYSLNKNANFHVALGHYAFADEAGDPDTLDTIHMGYSWSPWPSTRFGVELIGQNANRADGRPEEQAQVKFGAEKRF